MPEGHTLHALARDLTATFAGTRPQVSSPQGRFADGAALLAGRTVERAWAHGKLLFVEVEGDLVLHVHLGLIGTWPVLARPAAAPAESHVATRVADPDVQGQVRLRLLTDTAVADLRGPITCTVLTHEEVAELVARQGPDPLQPGADPDLAWDRLRRSRRTIAELLMDQTVLAGVGNVYRCEVLHRHRVAPLRPGTGTKRHTWTAIWDDLVRLMPIGVASGRIVTRDDDLVEVVAALEAGELPDPERRYAVYRRTGEPCPRCGARVRTRLLSGRNLFWCGNCQRRS